jgi:phage I-like protein
LIDATTELENRREQGALTEFRDAELQVAGLSQQRLGTTTVAFSHAVLDAFIAAGADCLVGLGLDQYLEHATGDLTDQIGAVADADRVEQD